MRFFLLKLFWKWLSSLANRRAGIFFGACFRFLPIGRAKRVTGNANMNDGWLHIPFHPVHTRHNARQRAPDSITAALPVPLHSLVALVSGVPP